jgi:Putative mono-oxygenase ydhR
MNIQTMIPRSLKNTLAVLAVAAMTSTIAAGQTADNAAPPTPVAVVTNYPIPPGLDRARIVAGMEKLAPKYQALPGLIRKYFTISKDQKFVGGIYLWKSRSLAEAYYNDAWRANVVKKYGSVEITYFDVPIAIEGPESPRH